MTFHKKLGWVLFIEKQSTPTCPIANTLAIDASTDNPNPKVLGYQIIWYQTKGRHKCNDCKLQKGNGNIAKNNNQMRKPLHCQFNMERP